MQSKEYAQSLLNYLNQSPTPFQSVATLSSMLDAAGARKVSESDVWTLNVGELCYFIKDGTQLVAFKLGAASLAENGLRIVAAHHDSPGLRIKPSGSTLDNGFERIMVEGYGGLIVHGWMDRPLGLAGRLCVRDGDGVKTVDINIKRPIMTIPSAAIHYVRDVNDGAKFSLQNEVCPILCAAGEQKRFMQFIASEAGVDVSDILSFELTPYDCQPACFTGIDEEFISAPRLDDAAMAHAAVSAFIEAADSDYTCLCFAYDHEEIGSTSTRGARSNTLEMMIERICEKLGLSSEDKYRALSRSMVFSADMAHATHPGYPGKSDPEYPIRLNKGPVLKLTTRQSYATSPSGSAAFKALCEKNEIPYQVFTNRSDERGGGTIGPGIAAQYGVITVDIGNPCLAMHAVREFGGSEDVGNMVKLMKTLYVSDLTKII